MSSNITGINEENNPFYCYEVFDLAPSLQEGNASSSIHKPTEAEQSLSGKRKIQQISVEEAPRPVCMPSEPLPPVPPEVAPADLSFKGDSHSSLRPLLLQHRFAQSAAKIYSALSQADLQAKRNILNVQLSKSYKLRAEQWRIQSRAAAQFDEVILYKIRSIL